VLTISENNHLQNIIITPPVASQTPREVLICERKKASMLLVLLVSPSFELQPQFVELEFNNLHQIILDQAVKLLCNIWHPQDVLNVFLMSSHAMVAGTQGGEPLTPLVT